MVLIVYFAMFNQMALVLAAQADSKGGAFRNDVKVINTHTNGIKVNVSLRLHAFQEYDEVLDAEANVAQHDRLLLQWL